MNAPRSVFLILFLLNSFFTYEIFSHSAHVLYQLPEWVSAKSVIPNGLISAKNFVLERQTLAGDVLNLASWNGPNEVHWNIQQNWDSLELDVSLDERAYFWIFLIQNDSPRVGIRLSRDDRLKSGFFLLNSDKEFLQRIDFPYVNKSKDFQRLVIKKDKNQLLLAVDNMPIFEKKLTLDASSPISFRSSLENVRIDNIKLINGDRVVKEYFSPRVNLHLMIISLIANIVLIFIVFLFLRNRQYAMFELIAAQMVILSLSITFYLSDKYIWAKGYYSYGFIGYSGGNITDFRLNADKARRKFFHAVFAAIDDTKSAFILGDKNTQDRYFIPENTQLLGDTMKKIYFSNGLIDNSIAMRRKHINTKGQVTLLGDFNELEKYHDSSYKIAFLGSSQTYGSGSLGLDKAFPSLTIGALNKCSKKAITGFNFSAPGEDSGQLINTYNSLLKFWKPDLLIVNLSHNDKDPENFRKNLTDLILLNKKIRIKTILITEPNSFELLVNHLKTNHQVIHELAQQYGISQLDLHSFLASGDIYDSGLLWWDIVHFDQAGHNTTAKWLVDEINRLKIINCK